jgi:hypothetical protein
VRAAETRAASGGSAVPVFAALTRPSAWQRQLSVALRSGWRATLLLVSSVFFVSFVPPVTAQSLSAHLIHVTLQRLPLRLEGVQAGGLHRHTAFGQAPFQFGEPCRELVVRPAQRVLRLDAQLA